MEKKQTISIYILCTTFILCLIAVLAVFLVSQNQNQKTILAYQDTVSEMLMENQRNQNTISDIEAQLKQKDEDFQSEREQYEQTVTALEQELLMYTPVYGNTKTWNPSESKTVYLTFDDGPSTNTDRILDILDEKGVKATFFVVGSGYYSPIKRAYNSGHAIGLHTYSHDYSVVYSSEENYFNDLKKIDKVVYDQIGIHTKIIRFPGGASNAVSKKYSPGIMRKLTRSVLREGYVFFDWNAANNDATGQPIDKEGMLRAVKETANGKKNVCVLMHDSKAKNTTVEALPEIIDYFKNEGYEFGVLTDKMPYLCQPLNN